MKQIKISGKIAKNEFLPDSAKNFQNALRLYEGKNVVVTIAPPTKERSTPQNGYLFGVVYKEIALDTGSTVEDVHDAMKDMFLSDHKRPIPHIRSTTKLTTVEFNEYFENIIHWAASYLGLYIELPNEMSMWGGL
jgi:hypothetical protein